MSRLKFFIHIGLIVILTFILMRINNTTNTIFIPSQENIQSVAYNYLVINTTMVGFAFTVLGMLYSFSSKDYVKKLSDTNIIINKAKVIMHTIIFCGISGFLNLFILIFTYKNWFSYLYVISLLSMIWSFAFFIKSMHCVYNLIKNIHQFDKQGGNKKYQKSEMESTKDTW